MNQTGFWNCTRAEKNASSETEKKKKKEKKIVDLLRGELIREVASTWQQRSAASCNRSQSETAMTRNCNHAILALLQSASCKPWTLILIAPARRKHSVKTNYTAESWDATTVAKRSVIENVKRPESSVSSLSIGSSFFSLTKFRQKTKLKEKKNLNWRDTEGVSIAKSQKINSKNWQIF